MKATGTIMNWTPANTTSLRALRAVAAAGVALLLAAAGQAVAADASSVDLRNPALTDTPGTTPSIPTTPSGLGVGTIHQYRGAVVLDSAILLKVYYYAFSKQPVDYSAVLTANTEMIDPPKPVVADAAQKAQIDAMIAFAKAHPNLVIRIDDIALDPFVAAGGYYPLDNRLFIHGVGYYFDNSPFHYAYEHPEGFRHLHCADAATRKTIDDAITRYVHYKMDIFASVTGANAADKLVLMKVDNVALRDDLGQVLISQSAS